MHIHPELLRRFGRDPKIILERDSYKCQICGVGEDLTIDHIDGNGRNSKVPNNDEGNLRTLCRKCHGKIDRKRRTHFPKHINYPKSRKSRKGGDC